MKKYYFAAALILLNSLPLTSFAAGSSDIDALIEDSRAQAQLEITTKAQDNQKLLNEITALEQQIEKKKTSVSTNSHDAKVDILIAAGTAIATGVAVKYFASKTGRDEDLDQMNIGFAAASFIIGAAATVTTTSLSGYNYLLVRMDKNKIAGLEKSLDELKARLEAQQQELLK